MNSGISMVSGVGIPSVVVSSATADPTSMLNNQLASALSTIGDAQYWEESISPSTIRTSLSTSDPSNPNSTPTLQRGMKWLLASISKGRDVSDFYPHVVKLVGATSLEVRKMVYMYLVQYADHDATTRELSLLSINSFQRGLADSEQLIRALALRVLSSIRVPDILQIQILGVQKCSKDRSPYVRKCAANALAKLSPRCDDLQQEILLDVMKSLLDQDTSTMVLTSVFLAFEELCPERLDLLHTSFRKVCHLLTDMDEWGQVVVIEIMSRYCRKYFKEPRNLKEGSAEKIDRERRVHRTLEGIAQQQLQQQQQQSNGSETNLLDQTSTSKLSKAPKKIKRRVVKKGFYSDEEDDSTEEEVYAESPLGEALSVASAMRQRNILGVPGMPSVNSAADEDSELAEDHQLLLRSAMPLLKSRNSGVVLAVCSLLYYCGVSSVKARSSMGKALVRIHRDRREIQFVVLTSIQKLVSECPSAFTPFLNDFFVKAMDPPFTRTIKLDILTTLALEPAAIEAVLKELRAYIRHGDKTFVCAVVRAVGCVVERTRIVYDRHGAKTGDSEKERSTANRIALDCLYGLSTMTKTCDSQTVVGECVVVMRNIILLLKSDGKTVDDPNDVQSFALRRVILLLATSLSKRLASSKSSQNEGNDDDADDEDDDDNGPSPLEKVAFEIPSVAVSAALWLAAEWLSSLSSSSSSSSSSSVSLSSVDDSTKSQFRLELCRLIDQTFLDLEIVEKEEALHLAGKFLMSCASRGTVASGDESAICEHILSMGRVDVNPDLRDQARFLSAIIHAAIGLKHDLDALESLPMQHNMTIEGAKKIFLAQRPGSSYLPVEDTSAKAADMFRFGTLSSLVGHKARDAYLRLPPWAEKDSPSSLRDAKETPATQSTGFAVSTPDNKGARGFYGSDSDTGSSSDSDSSSDSSSSEDFDATDDERSPGSDDSSSDSSSSDDNDDDNNNNHNINANNNLISTTMARPNAMPIMNGVQRDMFNPMPMSQPTTLGISHPPMASSQHSSNDEKSDNDDDDDSSSSSSSSSSSDASSSDSDKVQPQKTTMAGGVVNNSGVTSQSLLGDQYMAPQTSSFNGSAIDDFKGLVMAPVVIDQQQSKDPNTERDSSQWYQLVRPELCGGLSVMVRYLRGVTKTRELQLLNLDPNSATTLCAQVNFGNEKSDSLSIRRIRMLPRASPSGSISTRKVICPPEIPELKPGQSSMAMLGIDFSSPSDRDGDWIVRLDVKNGTGSIPVELKPSIAELLNASTTTTTTSAAEFDELVSGMQGFERVSSTFETNSKHFAKIASSVCKFAALTPIGNNGKKYNAKLRWMACLPASSNPVYVLIECPKGETKGTIVVCCDHAVAVNSILNVMKKAVAAAASDA